MEKNLPFLIGVDVGGSFTDLIMLDSDNRISVYKTPSTPDQQEKAIVTGLRALGIDPQQAISMMHGTTIATNAILEGHGAKTAYITNFGFADTLSIGRQTRNELYNLKPAVKPIPVEPELCFEIGGRITPQGEVIDEPSADDIASIKQQMKQAAVESVAVNLLFSFINSGFEGYVAEQLSDTFFVSCASALHPAPGEYERGIVSWLNARIAPLMEAYLKKLNSVLPHASVHIMQSHGHTVHSEQASKYAINLLLSGPAAGVMAVKHIAEICNESKVLSFDMGGTSTDISVIDGEMTLTDDNRISHWQIAVPMIDIQTIGAGGGSIAFTDEAGLLRLGPESAGSMPGPACYGRGGDKPTVTDANLLLGRIPTTLQQLTLLPEKAREAFLPLCQTLQTSIEEAAEGVIDIANEQMTQALRKTLTTRNHRSDEFLLCGFGAAAGLHICRLADGLQIPRAMIPTHAGILSAVGLLTASKGTCHTRSVCRDIDQITEADIHTMQKQLETQAHSEMTRQQTSRFEMKHFAELRYRGQLFCLSTTWQGLEKTAEAFHTLHERQYGHRLNTPVELVTLRLEAYDKPLLSYRQVLEIMAQQPSPGYDDTLPIGGQMDGPAIIADASCTVWLAKHWHARRDESGNIHLSKTAA